MADDIHAGQGGSYVVNAAGEKVLVHRTDATNAPATRQITVKQKPVKAAKHNPTDKVKA